MSNNHILDDNHVYGKPAIEAIEPPPYLPTDETPYQDMDVNPFHYSQAESQDNLLKSNTIVNELLADVPLPDDAYPIWSMYVAPTDTQLTDAAYADDLGFARLLHTMMEGRVVWDNAAKEWYLWTGQHWEADDAGDLERYVLCLLPDLYGKRFWDVRRAAEKLKKTLKDRPPLNEPTDAEIDARKAQDASLEALQRTAEKFDSVSKELSKRKVYKNILGDFRDLVSVSGNVWDTEANKVAFINGVVDMKTGQMQPGRPQDYIRTYTNIEWKGIDEPCPLWDKVTLELMGGDIVMRDYLLNLYALALMGKPVHQMLPILTGDGSNGKSMFVNIMAKVFGSLSVVSGHSLLLNVGNRVGDSASPTLAALHGKRLATVQETARNQYVNSAQIKAVTGNDRISARDVYKGLIEWEPTHTVFMVTNFPPHISDITDNALLRRLKLINFPRTFFIEGSKEYMKRYNPDDPMHGITELGLEGRLMKEEMSGIAADLIRRSVELHKAGLHLPDPEEVTVATAQYIAEEDIINEFITDNCIVNYDTKDEEPYEIDKTALYLHYSVWVKNCGYGTPMSKRTFTRALKPKGINGRRSNGKDYYVGIRLRTPDM